MYDPSDEYCKRLQPRIDAVASQLTLVPAAVVVRFDGEQNEIGVAIRRYPTVLLFKRQALGSRTADPDSTPPAPVEYRGPHTAAAITAFVREHVELGGAIMLQTEATHLTGSAGRSVDEL